MPVDPKETWRNVSAGQASVLKYDRQGQLDHEVVQPGKTVQLTPDERLTNEERYTSEDVDMFKNGVMVPVKLIDGTEDAAEIASNPNNKSEDDLRALYGIKSLARFTEEVESISNTSALQRLVEVAEEADATVRQVKVVQTHAAEMAAKRGDRKVTEVDTMVVASPTTAGFGAGVSPR